MKKNPYLIPLLFFQFSFFLLIAQSSTKSSKEGKTNFYDIQNAFYERHPSQDATSDHEVTDGEYEKFKRWEWYWEPRVSGMQNGQFPSADILWNEFSKYQSARSSQPSSEVASANWSFKGPSTTPGG